MKVIEKFKLSTKRFCFFYEFERMWILLTVINIIAIFIIVRGSTAPLIFDSKVLEFIFCTDKNADKTLYNIAISYFATYIFYLIQIYYPEKKKTMNALLSIRSSVHGMILWVTRFLFVWNIYKQEETVDEDEGRIRTAKVKTIYVKNSSGFIYKVDRDTFEDMVGRIYKDYEKIISNVSFQNCDYSLRRLLLEQDIGEYIGRLYEQIMKAEALDPSSSISIGYFKRDISLLQMKMEFLKKIFDLDIDTDFRITTDKKDIASIKKRDKEIMKVLSENKAFCDVLSQQIKK